MRERKAAPEVKNTYTRTLNSFSTLIIEVEREERPDVDKVKDAWDSKRDVLIQSGAFVIKQLSEAMSVKAESYKLSEGITQSVLPNPGNGLYPGHHQSLDQHLLSNHPCLTYMTKSRSMSASPKQCEHVEGAELGISGIFLLLFVPTAMGWGFEGHFTVCKIAQVWDTMIIESYLKTVYDSDLSLFVQTLLYDTVASSDRSSWGKCTADQVVCPDTYALESSELACEFAYKDVTPGATLGDDYFISRLPVVEKRLSQAGILLAATLNRIFSSTPSVSQE
ncbi:hypothetical protein POM88_025602 [Heracleum sosnowskyi]|uniref:Aspergillus nuclease S1 n=1 Tax=Heracleum sosnowskyi TaxID=360622 RepID=A0AAD8MP33_9APIA|nr:hypothetical protein POM88_025602 [Heracleum sosnowskyi]